MHTTLSRAPSARTFSIQALIDEVAVGRVRIPKFQRNFRWTADDVLSLFDSIYRGYPIGSLLLWKRDAPHAIITLGSLTVEAPATSDALWVVDGQQRITSLASVLLGVGDNPDPRFSIYFDLHQKKFVHNKVKPQPYWLPLNRIGDTRALLRWLGEMQTSEGAGDLITVAEDLARRIREYIVPAYIVETDDEGTLRTIFDRLNNYGKSLKSAEIFQALHGGRGGDSPDDLRTLQKQVESLDFGQFNENSLLRAVLSLRGADVYRDFRTEFSDDEDPGEAFRDTAIALERAIGFLRSDAEIPHLKLLPYRSVVPVLARFFHNHPEPAKRNRILLKRWIWRDALAAKRSTSVSSQRDTVRAITRDEDDSLQRLLSLAPRQLQPYPGSLSARLNEAAARANVAIMASWAPRSLIDGTRIPLSDYFNRQSAHPLPRLEPGSAWGSSLVSRLIHGPTASPLADLVTASPLRHDDPVTFHETLESHAIDPDWLHLVESGEFDAFYQRREALMRTCLADTAARLAEWDATDRPPIASLHVEEDGRGKRS